MDEDAGMEQFVRPPCEDVHIRLTIRKSVSQAGHLASGGAFGLLEAEQRDDRAAVGQSSCRQSAAEAIFEFGGLAAACSCAISIGLGACCFRLQFLADSVPGFGCGTHGVRVSESRTRASILNDPQLGEAVST